MESFEPLIVEIKKFLKIFNEPIFEINNSKITLSSVVISIIVFIVSIKLAKIIAKLVNSGLEKKSVDSGVRESLSKFVRYSIIAIGIIFALDNLGVSISSLAAVGAVLMVGIGFGLQNIAQNFISGIIILIERPIKVGDIIKVGTSTGRVIDIRVRATLIQTRDDVTIIVPNSKLVSEEVFNESYSGQVIRQHIKVGVAYGSDIEAVKSTLEEAAANHKEVLKDPGPVAIFEDFGSSSLDFDLRFWCSDIWTMERISSDIRFEIDSQFKKRGITIPFPQRDIHIIENKK